jgi:hypothetical protein
MAMTLSEYGATTTISSFLIVLSSFFDQSLLRGRGIDSALDQGRLRSFAPLDHLEHFRSKYLHYSDSGKTTVIPAQAGIQFVHQILDSKPSRE